MSGQQKWSKGPWTVVVISGDDSQGREDYYDMGGGDHYSEDLVYVRDYYGGIICDNARFYAAQVDPKNSNLIAAAPDLYDALEMAVLWLEFDGKYDVLGMKAALAKARGEN